MTLHLYLLYLKIYYLSYLLTEKTQLKVENEKKKKKITNDNKKKCFFYFKKLPILLPSSIKLEMKLITQIICSSLFDLFLTELNIPTV